jgi:hypothetical protein
MSTLTQNKGVSTMGTAQFSESADRIERARLAARLIALRAAGTRAGLAAGVPVVYSIEEDYRDLAYLAYLAGDRDPRD